jgi:hypothetical protein
MNESTHNPFRPSSLGNGATISSAPHDRTFVLRQYKPIPATIVSEVRADADPARQSRLPVIATVDRNVFSDNGRTIILPAGTQMLGYVHGNLPGPYKTIGRMNIDWYRFVRPDGVEFNFQGPRPFSADSQGRVGVPGRGSTDYMENMIMPMLTAMVPAAVNLIAPISDRFVNQIDLDNNTVTQSGQVRSSELAKQEIISTWNRVAQKMVLDVLDNTTPPFSIAAGTRITVFSPTDLIVTCDVGDPNDSRACAITTADTGYADFPGHAAAPSFDVMPSGNIEEWIGQVRALDMNMSGVCNNDGTVAITDMGELRRRGINDFRTAQFYCQSQQYQARTTAQWNAYYQQQQQGIVNQNTGQVMQPGTPDFNQNVLGMQTNQHGQMVNPFSPPAQPQQPQQPAGLLCEDGTPPDGQGCCTGEVLTDMGDQGWNCCPGHGGDCFPPLR